MKKKHWLLVLTAALGFGGTAAAVKKGEALFVTARNTRLQKDSSATSSALAMLQPGAQVIWQGADAANKRWHKVSYQGKSGVVFVSNLSPRQPSTELVASHGSGEAIDPQAFASSGAATKALSPAGLKYAEEKRFDPKVPKQLIVAEALSAQTLQKPEEIAAHARKAGLYSPFAQGGAK